MPPPSILRPVNKAGKQTHDYIDHSMQSNSIIKKLIE
uniref:Uncharacterized protein n=1 Tax=Lepeophtheirus salmonis TaxID=72036 RepID=A0A0K2V1P0_LEPSM